MWLEHRQVEPSLTDYYLMQVALHVASVPARVWGKDIGLKLSDFLLVAAEPSGAGAGASLPPRKQEGAPPLLPEGIKPPRRATKEDVARVQVFAAAHRLGLLSKLGKTP